jgi:hypothetical protein
VIFRFTFNPNYSSHSSGANLNLGVIVGGVSVFNQMFMSFSGTSSANIGPSQTISMYATGLTPGAANCDMAYTWNAGGQSWAVQGNYYTSIFEAWAA